MKTFKAKYNKESLTDEQKKAWDKLNKKHAEERERIHQERINKKTN